VLKSSVMKDKTGFLAALGRIQTSWTIDHEMTPNKQVMMPSPTHKCMC
jgi:hypothetical protein